MKQAQKDAEDNRRLTALAEAGAQIGGAIAGTGYNKAAFDSMREGADSKAKDILARRKAQTDELSAKSAHMKVAKEAESNDPDSAKSKAARDAYRKIAPKVVSGIPNYDMLSAADIEENLAKPLELYQRSEDRKLQYANIAEQKRQARQDKQDAKDEKKKTMLNEIEDRRQNINAALDTLDSMIKEYGTFELLGSHNQDMDRLVDQIATDMAKLQDPQSVARPGEVELVKKTLVQSGFKNSNATARDIIKNFRAEVDRRADSAYKIRGMEKPGSTTNAKSGTKSSSKYKPGDVINYKGKLYRVAPNGDDLEELM